MAIEKVNDEINLEIEPNSAQEIDAPTMEGDAMILDDGSAIVNPAEDTTDQGAFNANLADLIPEDELQSLASGLMKDYEYDKDARADWLQSYTDGLDLLGFKYEDRSKPFAGASGVTHPLLAETVTQFQAQAYKELLPPEGPVRTQIVGEITPQTEEQAQRVKEFMNYQITYDMEEYDHELDQMLFHLPLAGSSFKKVYYDDVKMRAVSKFVPAEDIVIPYTATDLETCERITHVVKMMGNDLRKKQIGGMYRDVDISPSSVDSNDAEDKYNELDGLTETQNAEDIVLLEIRMLQLANLLVLSYLMLSLLTKELIKFFPYTETTDRVIRSEKRYNILYTISFYPALVFMALALSTCSAVSPEQLRPHLDSSLMQVRCPTSLLALRQGDCVFEMTTNPFNPESSEM